MSYPQFVAGIHLKIPKIDSRLKMSGMTGMRDSRLTMSGMTRKGIEKGDASLFIKVACPLFHFSLLGDFQFSMFFVEKAYEVVFKGRAGLIVPKLDLVSSIDGI